MIHALDFSAGAGLITPQWAAKQKDDGYSLMISQLWGGWKHNPHAAIALTMCKREGHRIAGYTYLTEDYPGEYHVQAAKEAARGTWEQLEWLAIDCEYREGSRVLSPSTITAAIEEAVRLGVKPIIYTGEWYWRAYMRDSNAFKDYPLWTAYYDGYDIIGTVPLYGGWESVYGKQYKGTTNIDGIDCDLNVFDESEVLMRTKEQQTIIDVVNGWREQYRNISEIASQGSRELLDVKKALEEMWPVE